ncbi:hypothetical protein [Tuberibacillus sp. Marseille-P3662]|uniref:hypothetical protein n=1 Tax=Tuberibacillus sp. Marseille-P3662 TaxID=1965358 RepID=UPI000A1CCA55|nr:hypothetical protein [Tuberibacillus sp. Marseille-P3662]
MNVVVEPAQNKDYPHIKQFAEQVGVTVPEQADENTYYLLMKSKTAIVGVVGIELCHEDALLRTLVVDSSTCKSDDLFYFLTVALGFARERQAKSVYFVTPADPSLFEPLGFSEQSLDELPTHFIGHKHFDKVKESEQNKLLMTPLH